MDVRNYLNTTTDSIDKIIKQLYLVNPTFSFSQRLELAHSILDAVSNRFNVPISHVLITGSAHIGFSLKGLHDFDSEQSDLDLAIIDPHLFTKYVEKILIETNYLNDRHKFPQNKNQNFSTYDAYMGAVSKGLIHPRYFPFGATRTEWNSFFDGISILYKSIFVKITGCIYISEECFKLKQVKVMKNYLADTGKTI